MTEIPHEGTVTVENGETFRCSVTMNLHPDGRVTWQPVAIFEKVEVTPAHHSLQALDARLLRAEEIEAAARAFVETMGEGWSSIAGKRVYSGFTSESSEAARALADALGMEPEQDQLSS